MGSHTFLALGQMPGQGAFASSLKAPEAPGSYGVNTAWTSPSREMGLLLTENECLSV